MYLFSYEFFKVLFSRHRHALVPVQLQLLEHFLEAFFWNHPQPAGSVVVTSFAIFRSSLVLYRLSYIRTERKGRAHLMERGPRKSRNIAIQDRKTGYTSILERV